MSPVRTIHVDRTSFFLLSVSSPFPPQQLFIHFLSPDFKSEDILLPLFLAPFLLSLPPSASAAAVVTTGRKIGNFELLLLFLPSLPSYIGIVPAKSEVCARRGLRVRTG